MKDTLIGWCHHTINFWMGCKSVSDECRGCYAKALMVRQGQEFGTLRLTQGPWLEAELLNARANSRNAHELVFTCSMSDFFHEQSDPWRNEAWEVIRRCQNLIWLVLTKRPERISQSLPADWDEGRGFPNVWLGTTCGVKKTYSRVDILREIPCALRFLSCEPLMEDISDINLDKIGWMLCGGMSGALHKKYNMELRWAANLYETAQKSSVKFLFKQISHNMTERGINALGLYLAQQRGEAIVAETVDCVRQYPELAGFPIVQPESKGSRLDDEGWRRYCKSQKMFLDFPAGAIEASDGMSDAVLRDSALSPG